jgi:hypothetical protein
LHVGERLTHSSFASGHVQGNQALETGKCGLLQVCSSSDVGLLGGGELVGVEVHGVFLERFCCNAAI